jgi:hypothetical protein
MDDDEISLLFPFLTTPGGTNCHYESLMRLMVPICPIIPKAFHKILKETGWESNLISLILS